MSTSSQEQSDAVDKAVNMLSARMAGITYVVGCFIALGMNWAKALDAYDAIFISLLSWINVGYLLIKHAAR